MKICENTKIFGKTLQFLSEKITLEDKNNLEQITKPIDLDYFIASIIQREKTAFIEFCRSIQFDFEKYDEKGVFQYISMDLNKLRNFFNTMLNPLIGFFMEYIKQNGGNTDHCTENYEGKPHLQNSELRDLYDCLQKQYEAEAVKNGKMSQLASSESLVETLIEPFGGKRRKTTKKRKTNKRRKTNKKRKVKSKRRIR